MIRTLLVSLIFITETTSAITFKEALDNLEKHESVQAISYQAEAISKQGEIEGSWGDPIFTVAAKNFPKDNLEDDQTPMTGIEFGISQKIALSTKYGRMEEVFESLSQALSHEADDRKQLLAKALWELLILRRKTTEDLLILTENQVWISKILKVSRGLYSTGKTSQQAILEIQIRKSEIESEVSNKKFEIAAIDDKLNYLIGSSILEEDSIPWKKLDQAASSRIDNKELSLQEKLKATDSGLSASKLNYLPDLTVSLAYTKRSNIDDNGDFVGASVSFPLPLSAQKYSEHDKAVQDKYVATKNYHNYKKEKLRNIAVLRKELAGILAELNILKNKTIKFAQNSREITSKSYGLGNSSYIELLQSELKLQRILMHKALLEAQRDIKKATLKYMQGESLSV